MTDKNSIVLGVNTLKKVLELLPQDYSVSIQINNTIFPAQTFDISDDYEEIILKWFDLDYSSSSKQIFHIDDIKKIMLDLEKENNELKQSNKDAWNLIRFIYNEIKEDGYMDWGRIQDLVEF